MAEADAVDGRRAGGSSVGARRRRGLVVAGRPPRRTRRSGSIGAHTDSPNLRVKPRPDTGRAGWRQLASRSTAAPLLNSWLDRDLGLSGRVAVRARDGPARARCCASTGRSPRVPQLAIHLDREVNERGLLLDRQRHLAPVWGTRRHRPRAASPTFVADASSACDPDDVAGVGR